MEDRDLIFETVSLAGEILLASGAEISRVSDTMERIARAYGNPGLDTFILSNGVLLSTGGGPRRYQARVRHIPLGGGRLDRIDAVNQLSREIELGLHTPAEAHERLEAIRAMPSKPRWQQVLASGVGSASFGYLFGGTGWDAAAAFLCGLVLYLYFLYLVRGRLSKIAMNISGGALVTLCALILTHFGIGTNLEIVTAGAVVPLLPGVAFTNGIRDIADEDYISGSVRLLDAILVVACLALGVGAVMAAYTAWGGVSMQRFLCEVLAAGIGTVAFALIFHVPTRYYLRCGITGAAGWLVYLLFKPLWGVLPAIFLATFAVLCISRFSAVQLRCPATIFLIAGIFPLVPGLGIYQTAYAMVNNATAKAGQIGFTTLKTAIAMVLAILLGLELPGSWFRRLASHWSK